MIAHIQHNDKQLKVDLGSPIDISIPLVAGSDRLEAWYVDPIKITPVQGEGFIGSVKDGGSVNFRDIFFNPHGHGTHTECVGHISREPFSVNDSLGRYFFTVDLLTFKPDILANGDQVITRELLYDAMLNFDSEALAIRTLPNDGAKKCRSYSGTNPPYIDANAMTLIVEKKVQHLLLDLPSVDREVDGGALAAHHIFWNYPEAPDRTKTITELIYVPDHVKDGSYLLELQFPPFENDASPSRPLLYELLT